MLEGMKELGEELGEIGGCQELGVIMPVPNGEPLDPELEKAKEAWIAYSTPLWRKAGRSEEWIAQNIIDEWLASQDDIVRRYLAGDFTPPVPPPPPELEWYEEFWPYLMVVAMGLSITAIVLAMKKK